MTELDDPRKSLPAVSAMLEAEAIQRLIEVHTRPLVLDAIRDVLDECRRLLKPGAPPLSSTDVAGRVAALLDLRALDRTRPVVNATGILLHTGLGRAVLPSEAAAALGRLDRCCNLQIDLETGLRGKRNHSVEQLLCKLTGAEAAVIVNNNAAATLLILTALCAGKEVVVSRGQLIEIGGSFRLPDCIHQSGARLVEVGTTNKTHLRDYENALSENTGAVMRVNPSNYRVTGFTKEVPVAELVSLKQRQLVIVIDDLGCGALIPLEQFGLPHEPTVAESVAAGADIVCFSGDKLIGGPQAGIIVGKKDLVKRIRKHPLNRMLRVGKLTDVALEHTLRLFLEPGTLVARHPTLRMLTMPLDALKRRANRLKRRIEQTSPGLNVRAIEDESEVGGGSLPDTPLPTWCVALSSAQLNAERLSALLRYNEPPIIARIAHDEVLLDMRTLMDGDDQAIVEAVRDVK